MKLIPLKEVCKMYQPPTISTKEMIPDGDYVVYGANGPIGRYNKFNHEEPQLLVTCRGATCGAVNMSEPFAWINGNAMVIQPDLKLATLEYMKYAFLGGIDVSSSITGSAQPQITRTSLEVIKIPLPSIKKQREIVNKLDSAFTEIDLLEGNLGLSDEKVNQLQQSLLNASFAPAEAKLEPGNPSANQGLALKLVPLGEVCTLEYGKPLDKEFRKSNGDYFAYGANGPISPANKFLIAGPCVIVGRKGSAGEITFVEKNVWPLDVTYYIKHDSSKTDLRYLYFLLRHLNIKQFVRGVKPGLNRNDVYGLTIPLPSLEKQREIVAKLDSAFAEIEALRSQIQTRNGYALALRQSLLNSAFTQEEDVA